MKRSLAVAVVLLVAALGGIYGFPGHRGGGAETELRRQLQAAERLWAQRGAEDYDVDVSRSCFCSSSQVRLTVRGGHITHVQDLSGSVARTDLRRSARTVRDLFHLVSSSHADRVTATFDPTYGYPTSVSLDPSRGTIDEEYAYAMSRYVPVAPR